jgi:hypothetical protein
VRARGAFQTDPVLAVAPAEQYHREREAT